MVMIYFKKNLKLLLPIFLAFLTVSCGYHIGKLTHPQVKSIAIAPIKNNTIIYNVSAILRQQLNEKFSVFSNLKVKSQHSADAILLCEVISITTNEVVDSTTDNELTFRPAEWLLTMNADVTVIIPGRKRPLVKKTRLVGQSLFHLLGDFDTSRQAALLQASRQLAERTVWNTTEAW